MKVNLYYFTQVRQTNLECRTLYRTDLKPEQFLDPSLLSFYNNDYHGLFFGEIVAATGTDAFRTR